MTPQDFLSRFFDDCLEEGVFGIFTLPGASTRHFQTSEEAGKYAQDTNKCTFFSLGIFPEGVKKRGSEAEVIGLTCLHADVDIKGPAHTKENLPPTEEDALELIEQAIPESPPTLITNSGHGLQAFWIFKEPWMFDTTEERMQAKQLAKSFHATIGCAASGKGWTVDPTFNLDRVMRVCGTYNYKDKKDVREVKLVKDSGRFYNPEDFEDKLIYSPITDTQEAKQKSFADGNDNPYGLTLIETALPPEEKFDSMINTNPDFARLWHKQMDMEKMRSKKNADGSMGGDASLSSYDMSLANMVALYRWTPQEIADLIIAFRRKHMTKHADLKKALRYKYISDLLLKAYDRLITSEHSEELEKFHQEIVKERMASNPRPLSKEEANQRIERARAVLSAALSLRIEWINRYLSDPPYYELVLGDGRKVSVGSANQLLGQGYLRVKVFEATSLAFTAQKKKDWEHAITMMGVIMRDIETSEETRDEDAMRGWIKAYVEDAGVWEDPNDAVLDKRPFKKDGHTFLFGEKLRTNINLKGERLSAKEMGTRMSRIGCTFIPGMNFKTEDGKRLSRSVYDVTKALEESDE